MPPVPFLTHGNWLVLSQSQVLQHFITYTNYRPVSILSIVSKLLERHVHQLIFQPSASITPSQKDNGDFYPTGLTTLKMDIKCVLYLTSKKLLVLSPTVSCCRSFLNLDPFIIQWVCSYLTNRSQLVVGGEQSSVLPVISGVPQGSVLGHN